MSLIDSFVAFSESKRNSFFGLTSQVKFSRLKLNSWNFICSCIEMEAGSCLHGKCKLMLLKKGGRKGKKRTSGMSEKKLKSMLSSSPGNTSKLVVSAGPEIFGIIGGTRFLSRPQFTPAKKGWRLISDAPFFAPSLLVGSVFNNFLIKDFTFELAWWFWMKIIRTLREEREKRGKEVLGCRKECQSPLRRFCWEFRGCFVLGTAENQTRFKNNE